MEKDAEEEETHPSVNNKEDKNNQSPVVNGRDNIGDQFHNVGVVQIEDTTDCELLDYQKIDWYTYRSKLKLICFLFLFIVIFQRDSSFQYMILD